MQPENYQTNSDTQPADPSLNLQPPQPVTQTARQEVSPAPYTSNPFLVGLQSLIATLKVNPVPVMLIPLALLGFIVLMIIIALIATFNSSSVGNILATLVVIISYVMIVPWMLSTYYRIAASSIATQTISTKDAIRLGLGKALPMLGLMLLMTLIVVPGLIVFIVPGIYLMARVSLAPASLVAENVGVIAAIKRSFSLTKGHVIEMLAALLAGGIFGTNGILAPYFGVTQLMGRYQDLKALQDNQSAKPKTHLLNYVVVFSLPLLIAVCVGLFVISFNNLKQEALKQEDSTEQLFNDTFDTSTSDSFEYKFDY